MTSDRTVAADPETQYETLFKTLAEAYWSAPDGEAKRQIQDARDAAHKILVGIRKQKLEANTEELLALSSKIAHLQPALKAIQADIAKIVRNIEVSGKLESAIAGVLSLAASA